jgi:molecular chaperone HtpG
MATEKFTFQAEVSRLLNLVARSLYSHKEIFLRELISNAADACDRLRYAALTDAQLIEGDADFKITLSTDKKRKSVMISDNGIGMNKDELIENLGTIARSGTQAFVNQLAAESEKSTGADLSVIGQFGVGFYAAFMVAKKVDVLSRKAGESRAWLWSSDGKGEFSVAESERAVRGTTITLHLTKGEDEFTEKVRLSTIVKTYSDHIPIPVVFKEEDAEEKLNAASALWMRRAADVTEDQYKEFYHHVGRAFDDPWLVLHNHVEGVLSYTNLLFVPSAQPFDLFDPERKQHAKLYVNRVFITDDCEGLLPNWLRFIKGVVDSEDLPLNVNREMLQHDPRLAKIRTGLVKRVLGELKKKAEMDRDGFMTFWDNFGAVLKEGLYEDFENRDALLEIVRFRSTSSDNLTSLADYLGRMKDDQEAIYTISGDDLDGLKNSPQIEGFHKRGLEVLLLTDHVDEFWVGGVGKYKDKPFRSVTRGTADLSQFADSDKKNTTEKGDDDAKTLVAVELANKLKAVLGESVKDVRVSERLTESAVCLVADEGDMDMHLERLLKKNDNLKGAGSTPRILEINPDHALIQHIVRSDGDLSDVAYLLLDQARIMEGETVLDPQAFARRLSQMMEKGLAV